MSKSIINEDGIWFEVDIDNNQEYIMEISSSQNTIKSINQISDILLRLTTPIKNTYNELNKDMYVESAKLTVGIKVGVEGNFIVAKGNSEANIVIEMSMRPKNS